MRQGWATVVSLLMRAWPRFFFSEHCCVFRPQGNQSAFGRAATEVRKMSLTGKGLGAHIFLERFGES